MSDPLKIGVLASGTGSNLQAIMDAVHAGAINAEVAVVISDMQGAYALTRAGEKGIDARFVDPKNFKSREAHEREIIEIFDSHGVGLVLLAGYMRIVTRELVRAYPYRMMNIHPALLPSFPGLHVQEKAVEHGARFSGATVHFVDEGMDTGPIIIQAVVPVLPGDDADALAARILRQEHRIYPEAVRLFAEGRLKVQGRRVTVEGAAPDEGSHMINPPIDT